MTGGAVDQDAAQGALRVKHGGAALLPWIALDALLAKARAQRSQSMQEHAGAQGRPEAATEVQRAEGVALWVAQHGQATAILLGKRRCLRGKGWAHEHHAAVAGGKLSLAVAQLRDSFAAEQSAKVPHKDGDQRARMQKRAQRRGAAVLGQDRRVEQRVSVRRHPLIVRGRVFLRTLQSK